MADFKHAQFGKEGPTVFRLGLSATTRPGKETVHYAVDHGVNLFYAYGFDGHMIKPMREIIQRDREKYVIVTGAYNLLIGHPSVRRTLEKRLKQFRTDYIDTFLFLGVIKPKQFTDRAKQELIALREEGKVKRIGMSCHDRKFVGQLAEEGLLDAFMMRYNAAHRGAEQDIFPHLQKHDPAVISYTATRWRYLIRRPKGFPEDARIPTPGECYRFVLSNPNVDVALTAPQNLKQFKENLASLDDGPLNEEDMAFIKGFGDHVHHTKKWFMGG